MLIFQISKTAHGTGSLLSEYALKNELTMGNCCDSRKKKLKLYSASLINFLLKYQSNQFFLLTFKRELETGLVFSTKIITR